MVTILAVLSIAGAVTLLVATDNWPKYWSK